MMKVGEKELIKYKEGVFMSVSDWVFYFLIIACILGLFSSLYMVVHSIFYDCAIRKACKTGKTNGEFYDSLGRKYIGILYVILYIESMYVLLLKDSYVLELEGTGVIFIASYVLKVILAYKFTISALLVQMCLCHKELFIKNYFEVVLAEREKNEK